MSEYLGFITNQNINQNKTKNKTIGKASPKNPINQTRSGLINGAEAESRYKKTKTLLSVNRNPLVKLRSTIQN